MCSRNKLLAMDKIFCPGHNVFCLGQYFFVWDKIDLAWDKIYFVCADGMGISRKYSLCEHFLAPLYCKEVNPVTDWTGWTSGQTI